MNDMKHMVYDQAFEHSIENDSAVSLRIVQAFRDLIIRMITITSIFHEC